jgi:sugar/nucleoside kinase (ribokinase family)
MNQSNSKLPSLPGMKQNQPLAQVDIVSLGEIVMDMYPKNPGTRLAVTEDYDPQPGGANANVAVAAARLATRSAFIGKVGQDAYGESLKGVLKASGVETRGLRTDPVHPTTQVYLTPTERSSKRFKFNRVGGADLLFGKDDLDLNLIRSATVLHLTSLFLVSEPSLSAQREAINAARDNGMLISFDVNHRPGLWEDKTEALSQIRSLIRSCDILKVNEFELELLTGTPDPKHGIPLLLAEGVKLVAVTHGKKGSYYGTKDHSGHNDGFQVIDIDSLGCGDAFSAGMLVKLLEIKKDISYLDQVDLETIFRFANAVGALASTVRGAISSMPMRSKVDELVSRTSE